MYIPPNFPALFDCTLLIAFSFTYHTYLYTTKYSGLLNYLPLHQRLCIFLPGKLALLRIEYTPPYIYHQISCASHLTQLPPSSSEIRLLLYVQVHDLLAAYLKTDILEQILKATIRLPS